MKKFASMERASLLALSLIYMFALALAGRVIAGEFFDEFEDEEETADKWEILSGEWQIGMHPQYPDWFGVRGLPEAEGDPNIGVVLAKTPDGKGIYARDGVIVEAEFAGLTGGYRTAGLVMISYVNQEETYLAGGFTGGWQSWVILQIDSTPGVGFPKRRELKVTPMAGADAGAKAGSDVFMLKVSVEGNDVAVYIDDKEGARYTFPDGVPRGRIGLANVCNAGAYNWVRITGPGVMNVSNTGKLNTTWSRVKVER